MTPTTTCESPSLTAMADPVRMACAVLENRVFHVITLKEISDVGNGKDTFFHQKKWKACIDKTGRQSTSLVIRCN